MSWLEPVVLIGCVAGMALGAAWRWRFSPDPQRMEPLAPGPGPGSPSSRSSAGQPSSRDGAAPALGSSPPSRGEAGSRGTPADRSPAPGLIEAISQLLGDEPREVKIRTRTGVFVLKPGARAGNASSPQQT